MLEVAQELVALPHQLICLLLAQPVMSNEEVRSNQVGNQLRLGYLLKLYVNNLG